MSQANVDAVRRMFEASWQGDLAEAESLFSDDVVWHNTRAFPGRRTIVGPKAIFAFWQELFESFEGQMEIEQARAGEDRVVLGLRSRGQGTGSGIPLDFRWALIFALRGGKVTRVDVRGDFTRALEAAGLSG